MRSVNNMEKSALDNLFRDLEKRVLELEAELRRFLELRPLIFLGPSLDLEEAARILDAEFRPPIKRGDLLEAIRDGFRWIGIIDGTFHQNLTVSVQEIRHAMEQGVHLYGSSS